MTKLVKLEDIFCYDFQVCFIVTWTPYGLIFMNSIFFDPEKVTPELNALSLLLKESFYLWTPLVYIIFDSRFYSIFFYENKRKKLMRLVNKEIEENNKSFHRSMMLDYGTKSHFSSPRSEKKLLSSFIPSLYK